MKAHGLYQIDNKIRKLSPRECARLQGFPEDFILPKSVTEAHRQFGNSVSINVLQWIIEEIVKTIENKQTSEIRFINGEKRFQAREGHRQEI